MVMEISVQFKWAGWSKIGSVLSPKENLIKK